LQSDKYPGWLYSIKKGATTMWERWDGVRENGDFQTPSMNSFNHYSFGSVGEWMYGVVAGIEVDEGMPGFRHVVVAPKPGGTITSATGRLETMYGVVESSWAIEGTPPAMKTFRLKVTVPVNATATVRLPYTKGAMEVGGAQKEAGVFEIGAGKYEFVADVD
jgi:alpha-L-rhamnosidase